MLTPCSLGQSSSRPSVVSSVGGLLTSPTWPFVGSLLFFRDSSNLRCCVDYGYKKERLSRQEFIYRSPLQPYLAWWGVFWTTFFVITSGIQTWFKWDTSAFFTFCKSFLYPKSSREIHLVGPQIATFPSSLPCTSVTSSPKIPRSSGGTKWTSLLVYQLSKRQKLQKSRLGTFGKGSLPLFSE